MMNLFSDWLNETDLGCYILERERDFFLRMIDDVFGFHALQLGLPQHDFLSSCRIPWRFSVDENSAMVCANLNKLPLNEDSFDLVVLPHTLDFSEEPHQVLSEVKRILVHGGRLVITGFNPHSIWGFSKVFADKKNIPWNGQFLSLLRIKDWLKLLDFEMEEGSFMAYSPPFASRDWLNRFSFMEKAGNRWWPMAAGVYGIKAIKTTKGMHLLRPEWNKQKKLSTQLVTVNKKQCNNVHKSVMSEFDE